MPANVHRARQLGWCLPEIGWEVEVLTPSVEFQRPEWLDEKSVAFFPPQISYHEVPPPGRSWMRKFGAKSMAWRALLPMYRRGCELLASGRFDLIYITTTVFSFFCLGELWRRKFEVPYVLDFHDPWYRPNQNVISCNRPLKAWLNNQLARHMEAYAVENAAGLIAVSPDYLQELREHYPSAKAFQNGYFATIPFGVLPLDFELARQTGINNAGDETRKVIYVGVGAEIMAKSFRRLADGLLRLRRKHVKLFSQIRLQLFGTDGRWKNGMPKILENQSLAAGIGNLVMEDPRIIPYRDAIGRAVAADGLLVLGVDEPAYMPSKLFLYALTGKPLLACMHSNSQVNDYFRQFPELGTLIHFNASPETENSEDSLLLDFLSQVAERKTFPRESIRREFSAAAMAQRHTELFEACLERKK